MKYGTKKQYNQFFLSHLEHPTEVLVYAFENGEYKSIIILMMVLCCKDVLLEPSKEAFVNAARNRDRETAM